MSACTRQTPPPREGRSRRRHGTEQHGHWMTWINQTLTLTLEEKRRSGEMGIALREGREEMRRERVSVKKKNIETRVSRFKSRGIRIGSYGPERGNHGHGRRT